jgi:hypothetical protein
MANEKMCEMEERLVSIRVDHISVYVDRSSKARYRGADKSLARLGKKQATFRVFCGTLRLITTFTRVHLPSLP